MVVRKGSEIDVSKHPRWFVRRWRIFSRTLLDSDFREALPALSADYKDNQNLPTAQTLGAIRVFGIPSSCVDAYYAVLEKPDYVDKPKELIKLIKPPIRYLSFKHKVLGISDNPEKDFKYWQKTRKEELHNTGSDLLELSENLLISVEPYTTKSELLDFINGYFDSRLKPLLTEAEVPFTPEELRAGRVREKSKLKAQVIKLHRAGKSPKEIEKILGYRHWASNISKIISEYKKSH